MCGIAGFVERNPGSGRAARERLWSMLQTITHRGPDDWGMHFFGYEPDDAPNERILWDRGGPGVALGHRRLSILDLSPAGRQPFVNRRGGPALLLNGEIYNYVELREELSKNAAFHTGTDTEVVLEAYRQWGIDMFKRFDGMFAIALWDPDERQLICARDPMSIKPFYFAATEEGFFFGSEPRTVLKALGSAGSIDQEVLADFLLAGVTDHGAGTFYNEVRQLTGGTHMIVRNGQCSTPVTFWTPPSQEVDLGPKTIESLRERFDTAIKFQLRSDVPVGACLSGGTDSSAVVSTVARLMGQDASNFTVLTLHNKDFPGDEIEAARKVAKNAGVHFEPVLTSPEEVSRDLPSLCTVMGEPFGSLSMLGQYRIMSRAQELGLKVMLDGQGGDEVFLGYPRVASRIVRQYLSQGKVGAALSELSGFSSNASLPPLRTIANNVAFGSAKVARKRYTSRLAGLVREDLLDQGNPGTLEDIFGHRDMPSLQYAELKRITLPRLLRYEDRNSMRFSVEARVPILAVPLVEMALQTPVQWKVRNGWTKYMLRAAMEDRVPKEIVWSKQKRGFEVPQSRWVQVIRKDLGDWLCDLPTNGPIDFRNVLSKIDSGMAGSQWLWRCVSVGLWMRFCEVKA